MLSLFCAVALGLSQSNLLEGATLKSEDGVTRAAVLHDGQLTFEGDNWDTQWTTLLRRDVTLEFDLGAPKQVGAVLLQADNNDTYVLSASLDGVTFTPFWTVKGDPLVGMRTRSSTSLDVRLRYLRVNASAGDGLYSIGELALYPDVQALDTDTLIRQKKPERPSRGPPTFDFSWLVLAAVTGTLFWYFAGLPRKP